MGVTAHGASSARRAAERSHPGRRVRDGAPPHGDLNYPRRRGACALSRSSAARRALEDSPERSRQATGNSRPCGYCLNDHLRRGPETNHPHLAAQAAARKLARRRSRARASTAPSTRSGGAPAGPRTATGGASPNRRTKSLPAPAAATTTAAWAAATSEPPASA